MEGYAAAAALTSAVDAAIPLPEHLPMAAVDVPELGGVKSLDGRAPLPMQEAAAVSSVGNIASEPDAMPFGVDVPADMSTTSTTSLSAANFDPGDPDPPLNPSTAVVQLPATAVAAVANVGESSPAAASSPAASAAGDKKKDEQEQKVRAACESCYERKVRCIMTSSGECQQCIEKGRKCERSHEKKRGRPRLSDGGGSRQRTTKGFNGGRAIQESLHGGQMVASQWQIGQPSASQAAHSYMRPLTQPGGLQPGMPAAAYDQNGQLVYLQPSAAAAMQQMMAARQPGAMAGGLSAAHLQQQMQAYQGQYAALAGLPPGASLAQIQQLQQQQQMSMQGALSAHPTLQQQSAEVAAKAAQLQKLAGAPGLGGLGQTLNPYPISPPLQSVAPPLPNTSAAASNPMGDAATAQLQAYHRSLGINLAGAQLPPHLAQQLAAQQAAFAMGGAAQVQTSAGMQVAGLAGLSAAMGAPGAGVAPPGSLVAPSRQQIAPPIPGTQQAADASGANAFANIGLANVPTGLQGAQIGSLQTQAAVAPPAPPVQTAGGAVGMVTDENTGISGFDLLDTNNSPSGMRPFEVPSQHQPPAFSTLNQFAATYGEHAAAQQQALAQYAQPPAVAETTQVSTAPQPGSANNSGHSQKAWLEACRQGQTLPPLTNSPAPNSPGRVVADGSVHSVRSEGGGPPPQSQLSAPHALQVGSPNSTTVQQQLAAQVNVSPPLAGLNLPVPGMQEGGLGPGQTAAYTTLAGLGAQAQM